MLKGKYYHKKETQQKNSQEMGNQKRRYGKENQENFTQNLFCVFHIFKQEGKPKKEEPGKWKPDMKIWEMKFTWNN